MKDGLEEFSGATVMLHWLLAFAMIAMLVFGLVLEEMPRGDAKAALMWWHKGLGVAILAFAAWRLAVRLANGMPPALSRVPAWQQSMSRATHWFLLAGTLFMPLSGMLLSLSNGRDIDVLGSFTIAAWEKNHTLHEVAEVVHGAGGKLLILAIGLHVVGALKHHWLDRDGTLARMLGRRVPAGASATADGRQS